MLQLTYISTAARDVEDADIAAILSSSRRRNVTSNVTGLLLYDGKRFLQDLEGEAVAVDRANQRIKVDARHRSVVLLSSRVVVDRAFGDWSMAAQRVVVAASEKHTHVGRSADR